MATESQNPKCLVCGHPQVQIGRSNPDGTATFRCMLHGGRYVQTKKIVQSRWPKAKAVKYPHDGTWHIGDGYGGFESDLGSADTEAGAWAAAYESENARKAFSR